MKYKLLLLGSNQAAIEDFFKQLDNEFELMTTSMHFSDIKNSVRYFEPDAIIYCMQTASQKVINSIQEIKVRAVGRSVPFVILGNKEDCDAIMANADMTKLIKLAIRKPITAVGIKNALTDFLAVLEISEDEFLQREQAEAEADLRLERDKVEIDRLLNSKDAPVKQEELVQQQEDNTKQRILVIDDDVRMIKIIKSYLQDYQVASAVSGKIALKYLETKHVDMILLDYVMPEMSGPEVIEKLRLSTKTRDIPVVFLTGASEREKIAKALSLKPRGYLLKPIDSVQLMDKIHEVLG